MSVLRTSHHTAANIPPTAVDDEIDRLRQTIGQMGQQLTGAEIHTPLAITREETRSDTLLLDVLNEICIEINLLSRRMTRLETANSHEYNRREDDNDAFNMAYVRAERDIKNRRSTVPNFLSLKEARIIIPEFNGTSRSKLQEFLNASTYAINHINPAKEKLSGPTTTRIYDFPNRNKTEQNHSRQNRETNPQCYKCEKTGHYGRDCRSSRYALPKPDKSSRVNVVKKFCQYCKKCGHNRDECWSLNGGPKAKASNRTKGDENKKPRRDNKGDERKKHTYQKRSSDSESSSDEDKRENNHKTTRVLKYQVTHVQRAAQGKAGLDLMPSRAKKFSMSR